MSEQLENNVKDKERGVLRVNIKWGSVDKLDTIYINNMTITHAGPEFYLVFGELPIPAMMNQNEAPSEIEIIPKVRLAITPDAMKQIARVINENLTKYADKEG